MRERLHAVAQGFRRSWQLQLLFVLPLAYIVIFKYVPMYGAQIAFKDFIVTRGITGSQWVGFANFARFFNSYDFWRIMKNTLGLSVYSLVAGFPLPILLALSLNYVGNRFFKRFVQMASYAPHFISVVVMSGIILQFLSPRTGALNILLGLFGVEPIHFMANPAYFKSIYVWSEVWQNVGFGCIIYLAALASIDPTLHEAAIVDGATRTRRIWHVDLPGIMPIAVILFILNMGYVLDVGFEKVLLLQNPLNLRTSEVIDTYVYKVGLATSVPNFSYAAAIGVFKAIIGMILIVGVNKAANKMGQVSLW